MHSTNGSISPYTSTSKGLLELLPPAAPATITPYVIALKGVLKEALKLARIIKERQIESGPPAFME